MTSVDWRYRFGNRWITTVRDQGSSANCWAFAMTALYEAMARINHCVWARRSEGDLARGVGKQSWALGNFGECGYFAETYGLADPDCFPWSEAAAAYLATPASTAGAALEAHPIAPTSDRVGRAMRIDATHVWCGTRASKRKHIALIGPMAVMFDPPASFSAAHPTDVYEHVTDEPGAGLHAVLVVGFDDIKRCWIVKNSWGTGWADHGFAKVSFDALDPSGATVAGAGLLEREEFLGVQRVNPDPWSKRRQRNGALIESGNGSEHNNFELFIQRGKELEHWWREHGAGPPGWHAVGVVPPDPDDRAQFGADALDCPATLQSTFNRNFELVYRCSYDKRLRHIYFDQISDRWYDLTLFGPYDGIGIPGFIQTNEGAPGALEVVVACSSGRLEHWRKQSGFPWAGRPGTWTRVAVFGSSIAYGGPALTHVRAGASDMEGSGGTLHYVATGTDDTMRHYTRQDTGSWSSLGVPFGSVQSAPCLLQSARTANERTPGAFELFVAAKGTIEHWTFSPRSPGRGWSRSPTTFGGQIRRVVGAVSSSFAFRIHLVAERTDGRYQHFVQSGNTWLPGALLP